MVMSVLRALDLILAQSHLYKRKELRGYCFPSQTGQQAKLSGTLPPGCLVVTKTQSFNFTHESLNL